MTKAASVKKGEHCWYGICNHCGDFAAVQSQPHALACVLDHLKAFASTPKPVPVLDAAELAAMDRAKASADHTLNNVICHLRHQMAAGADTTSLWNEAYEEWCQHGSPMLAFAFATAVVRLAVPQGG